MNSFYQRIIQEYAGRLHDADTAMPGINGPYHTRETFIRNTAHWIITFSIMYQRTSEPQYKQIVQHLTDSLTEAVEKSKNGAVECLPEVNGGPFSRTNGLIGLAWLIEGLSEAYEVLGLQRILRAAEKVFFSQSYNSRLHTWEIIDSDNKNHGVDMAFNHTLWFCMAAAKLLQYDHNEVIEEEVLDYLKHLENQFTIYKNGLISHFTINSGSFIRNAKTKIRKKICAVTGKGIPWSNWNTIEYERAYHLFSLYAFAWLYRFYPQADFFKTRKFDRIKEYGLYVDNFIDFPEMNSYAYGYNSPAYELPLIQFVFGSGEDEQGVIQTLKLHKKYNIAPDGISYSDNVADGVTLDARIYEIVQYYKLKGPTS